MHHPLRCALHSIVPLALIGAALFLSACQVPLPYLPPAIVEDRVDDGTVTTLEVTIPPAATPPAAIPPTATPSDSPSTEVILAPTPTPSTETTDVATDVATDEQVNEVGGDDVEATDSEAGEADTVDSVQEGETIESPAEVDEAAAAAPAVEATGTLTPPIATVLTRSLRVRTAPDTEADVVAGAVAGESFPILAELNACEWLNVEHPTLGSVWISGLAEYTSIDRECASIAADIAALAAGIPSNAATEENAANAADAATADSPAPSSQTQVGPLPEDQGCYLLQNQLGPPLDVTIQSQEREWTDSFRVDPDEEVPYCLLPGVYTVIIDAPAPWADLSDELTVRAGDRFFWPIRSDE